jgi:hypothetical protein
MDRIDKFITDETPEGWPRTTKAYSILISGTTPTDRNRLQVWINWALWHHSSVHMIVTFNLIKIVAPAASILPKR